MIQHYVCTHCGDIETVDSSILGGMIILEDQFGWSIKTDPKGLPVQVLCPLCKADEADMLASAQEAVHNSYALI